MNNILDPEIWARVPFHFWSVVFFVFGSMVGSFLNVCIYRMPREMSVVMPPSHCPRCDYQIPWYLNMPLVTWLVLGGKCANCRSSISFRYFAVEFLTGAIFLTCWLVFGASSPWVALGYSALLAGFIAATFIDFEHFIIPDEITIGGIAVGFLFSMAAPALHDTSIRSVALERSIIGIVVGLGIVYAIVRLGKLMFGRQDFELEPDSRVVFSETALHLPDNEIPYEEIFYRKSDTIRLKATQVELVDRCYMEVDVGLSPNRLTIGKESFDPETVPYLEVATSRISVPREAMGLGDVKFMGAIGAFLGWQATVFSLMASSIVGAIVGVALIASGRREWSSRIPFGPYIALAAVIWIFLPDQYQNMWREHLGVFGQIFRGRRERTDELLNTLSQ